MESLLRPAQVAELLNVRPSTLYALCYRGVLPYIRIRQGKRRPLLRFKQQDIEQFLQKNAIPMTDGK